MEYNIVNGESLIMSRCFPNILLKSTVTAKCRHHALVYKDKIIPKIPRKIAKFPQISTKKGKIILPIIHVKNPYFAYRPPLRIEVIYSHGGDL